jgi:hypothetical protein
MQTARQANGTPAIPLADRPPTGCSPEVLSAKRPEEYEQSLAESGSIRQAETIDLAESLQSR